MGVTCNAELESVEEVIELLVAELESKLVSNFVLGEGATIIGFGNISSPLLSTNKYIRICQT